MKRVCQEYPEVISGVCIDMDREFSPSDTRQSVGSQGARLSEKLSAREVMPASVVQQIPGNAAPIAPWPVTPRGSCMRGTLSTQIAGPRMVTGKRAEACRRIVSGQVWQ
jgi:hypothetical protein